MIVVGATKLSIKKPKLVKIMTTGTYFRAPVGSTASVLSPDARQHEPGLRYPTYLNPWCEPLDRPNRL